MAFTPSNLYTVSLGSLRGNIAKVNGSITSGTNNWNSRMTDIVAVTVQTADVYATGSVSAMSISYTQSNGTIWVNNPIHNSGNPFIVFVYSGMLV